MTAHDQDQQEKQFLDLLVVTDEALGLGQEAGMVAAGLAQPLEGRLRRLLPCLARLHQHWPASSAWPGSFGSAVSGERLIDQAGPMPQSLGHYTIEQELGRGSFAVVYAAIDQLTGRRLALKLLRRFTPAILVRFKQEFRKISRLLHPNLVRLDELVAVDDLWFITMERIVGQDFRSHLRQRWADWESWREAVRQLAEGVAALHAAGILHRDLKPANVLVTAAGQVKIVDYGLATYLDRPVDGVGWSPYLAGTAAYMAPEQAAGLPPLAAGDWYSVGVMLFEVLTGQLPFPGTPYQQLRDKLLSEPPAPADLIPEVPPDLNAICRELLRRQPEGRLDRANVLRLLGGGASRSCSHLASLHHHQPIPFVGRDRELHQLREAVAQGRHGQGVVIWLHGQSGIGKSRLLQHFLDELRHQDVLLLTTRCHEHESIPYGAIDGLIDALVEQLRSLPPAVLTGLLPAELGQLGQVFPVLRQLSPVKGVPAQPGPGQSQAEMRREAFRVFGELMARLARHRLLVLAIDDLQWGDLDSAGPLVELLRWPEEMPLLLLACYRSEDAGSPLLGELQAVPRFGNGLRRQELALGPLLPSHAQDLAEALGADQAEAQVIARESGGSPLYLGALARHRQQAGASAEVLTLDGVLWSQVRQLPAEALALLEVISIAGRPLPAACAFRAAALAAERQDLLSALKKDQLVRAAADGALEEAYHFRIRQTVTAHLAAETARGRHLALAQALEAEGQPEAENLSYHFEQGGEPEKAANYALQAANRASTALAFDRAAKLYRRVLNLKPQAEPQQAALRRQLADALVNAGRGVEAAPEYFTLAEGAGPVQALELHRLGALSLGQSGRAEEARAALVPLLALIGEKLAPSPWRARLSATARLLWLRLTGFRSRLRPPDQPLSEAERLRLEIYKASYNILMATGTMDGFDFLMRLCHQACRAGDPFYLSLSLAWLSAMAFWDRQGRSFGRKLYRQAQRLFKLVTDPTHQPYLQANLIGLHGLQAMLEGRWRAAGEECEQALALGRQRCQGVAHELSFLHLYICWSLAQRGRLTELGQRLWPILQEARDRGDLFCVVNLKTAYSPWVLLANDDPTSASQEITSGLAQWPATLYSIQRAFALRSQVMVNLYADRPQEGWEQLHLQWPDLVRAQLTRMQILRIDLESLRGRTALALAAAASKPGPFLQAAAKDARRLEREKAPWAEPLAKLLRAGSASLRGEKSLAASLLASAADQLDAADMTLYAAAARRCLGTLSAPNQGQALIAAADAIFQQQKVRNPTRFTAMLVPGF